MIADGKCCSAAHTGLEVAAPAGTAVAGSPRGLDPHGTGMGDGWEKNGRTRGRSTLVVVRRSCR